MDAIRSRRIESPRHQKALAILPAFLLVAILWPCLGAAPWVAVAAAEATVPLVDAPVRWFEGDQEPIPVPEVRDPSLWKDYIETSILRPVGRLTHPGRLVRRVGGLFGGDPVPPADNVNALDEVPNSTWFTNRIGLQPMTSAAVACGPGGRGPDRSSPWTICAGKTDGVTFGFRIRDALGDQYLLKFDPPRCPGMTIRAGVVSNLIFHACGYNVPEDKVVDFRREDLVVGPGVDLKLPYGGTRRLTEAGLDSLLRLVCSPMEPGHWCALASKFLPGRTLGPFPYRGRRHDDPNDRIRHEDRRELRGLKVFAAWLNHTDTKQQNTLDVYVGQPNQGHVQHYLIDFASTLGAGGRGTFPKPGYEYEVDWPPIMGRLLTLGFHNDSWTNLERPEGLYEIGYLDNRYFDPADWKPTLPNSAFANLTNRDGYWAAKIISAFTGEQLEAIVAEAQYQDPRAAVYMVRALMERRDIIARFYFDLIAPLDFFLVRGDSVTFTDLGAARGIYPGMQPHYRARWASATSTREPRRWTPWQELGTTAVPWPLGSAGAPAFPDLAGASDPFLALQCQVDRGKGWSRSVTVYLSRAGRKAVAVDH
jgi:hypothetical protein